MRISFNDLFSFLIDTSSGQVIGIDFGSAFNAATIVRLKVLYKISDLIV
jgi:hypothetical protein